MSGPETSDNSPQYSDTDTESGSGSDGNNKRRKKEQSVALDKSKMETFKQQKKRAKREARSVKETKKLLADMSDTEIKELSKLHEDMTAKSTSATNEGDKLKLFKKAAKKVIMTNRLAAGSGKRAAAAAAAPGAVSPPLNAQRRTNMRANRGQTMLGVNPEELTKLKALQDAALKKEQDEIFEARVNQSGFSKFFSKDAKNCHHDELDPGVNAMALLCGLVVSVPYTVMEGLDYENLDLLKARLAMCPKNDWSYDYIYNFYRASYTATVYFSIAGMIFATFYFLFKRNCLEDFLVWRNKARLLVFILFLFTATAIIGLILLTNLFFEYFMIDTETDICDAGTGGYVFSGMAMSAVTFIGSTYLII